MPYVNATDSTEGFQDDENLVIAYDEGTKGTPAVKDAEGNITEAAVKADGGTCRCGCGAEVPAGSLFKPGHDARLKGKLTRAFLANVEVTLRVDGQATTGTVDSIVTGGFGPKGTSEALAKAIAKAEAKARTAEQRKADREAKAAEKKAENDARKATAKAAKDAAEAAKAEAEAAQATDAETPKRGRKVA